MDRPLAAGRRLAKLVGSMGLPSSGVWLSCLETQSGPQRPWGCPPGTDARVAVVVASRWHSRSSAAEGPSIDKKLLFAAQNASWSALVSASRWFLRVDVEEALVDTWRGRGGVLVISLRPRRLVGISRRVWRDWVGKWQRQAFTLPGWGRCQVWSVVDHPDGCREASLGFMDPALILGAAGTCLGTRIGFRGLAAGTSLLCKRYLLD